MICSESMARFFVWSSKGSAFSGVKSSGARMFLRNPGATLGTALRMLYTVLCRDQADGGDHEPGIEPRSLKSKKVSEKSAAGSCKTALVSNPQVPSGRIGDQLLVFELLVKRKGVCLKLVWDETCTVGCCEGHTSIACILLY